VPSGYRRYGVTSVRPSLGSIDRDGFGVMAAPAQRLRQYTQLRVAARKPAFSLKLGGIENQLVRALRMRSYVVERSSGSTRVSPTTVMKFASPDHLASTCK